MGLNLEISLETDIREMDEFFDDLKFKVITNATRQALNRAGQRIKAQSNKEIRKRRNMKLSEVKRRIFLKKAKGNNIAVLEARVNFSGIPLPLILFLVGQKTPKSHKVANRLRKPRSFQVVKGQKKKQPGLFVQKANRGKMQFQVFRRADPSDKSKGFKKQSAPSIAQLLRRKSNLLRKIENNAINVLQKEFDRALAFQRTKHGI